MSKRPLLNSLNLPDLCLLLPLILHNRHNNIPNQHDISRQRRCRPSPRIIVLEDRRGCQKVDADWCCDHEEGCDEEFYYDWAFWGGC